MDYIIPAVAVDRAAAALAAVSKEPWDTLSHPDQEYYRSLATLALQAATPHLLGHASDLLIELREKGNSMSEPGLREAIGVVQQWGESVAKTRFTTIVDKT